MQKELESLKQAQLAIDDDLVEKDEKTEELSLSNRKFGGSAEFDADIEENTPLLSDEDSREIETGTAEPVTNIEGDNDVDSTAKLLAASTTNFPEPSSIKSSKPSTPRGKKAKLKKINAKYADQDEEDRQVAIELLGSGKGPQPKGKKAKALAEKQRLQEEKADQRHLEAEKFKQQKKPKQSKNIIPKDEIEVDLDSLDLNLDCLTGLPADDDEILACLPVCAPWTVLQKYKYRIKLLPGSLKKGKGAKSAQASFIAMATKAKAPQELEAIRNVLDQTWIDTMLAKTKLESR